MRFKNFASSDTIRESIAAEIIAVHVRSKGIEERASVGRRMAVGCGGDLWYGFRQAVTDATAAVRWLKN